MSEVEVEESIMSYLSQSETDTSTKDLNVVAMLHNFWEQRQTGRLNGSSSESDGSVGDAAIHTESLLLYESAPSPGPPYVCYVTLPGGSCFGNYKVCETQAEARRDAARVALMNSLVNELPCRRINPQFITHSLQQAATDSAVSVEDACDSSTSIGTYSVLLRSYVGKTMLEFQVKHKAKAYFSSRCAHKSCGNCVKYLFTSKDSGFVKGYFAAKGSEIVYL
ncbi:protein limb expression 1 homolog [Anarrhichthys ocellatus]|uniref:protein limb expression 1 homolog n=1 Tax=Anarrhichthys ocellatus TaxID=433405 RepID=UPI0012ECE519|nr:protein limb expression 1 homolog [Anarrhichthys ocellatus]XP_031735870.1 protein limb expression 1 homolog [Anarrhichthys ocellatus]